MSTFSDSDIDVFVAWFRENGGQVDTQVMAIAEIPDSGRGAIALCDIPTGHTLFTLPRTLTLSTRTSPLPALFGLSAWRVHRLHRGWVGLILCMMWEDAWAHERHSGDGEDKRGKATWAPYMGTLPSAFDTPIFWSAEELGELKGTAVIDKIGRDDAERAYWERVVPAVKTSPILFPPSHHHKWYTLDAYHRAGSRILSRSFTVSRWTEDGEDDHEGEGRNDGDEGEDIQVDTRANTSLGSAMDVDDPQESSHEDAGSVSDEDDEDEDEDPSDVAMVPMADLLNARWGSENAKLFYEPLILRMVTTREIKQGEQIFNTYGDPPNSDLLRRYGHVDLVRLDSASSEPTGGKDGDVQMNENNVGTENIDVKNIGNPSDVVEIRADLVVGVIQNRSRPKGKDVGERIEWWLDEGEDDTFLLSTPISPFSDSLPPPLISLTRLLLLPTPDFTTARSKGKLPKGKLKKGDTNDTKEVLEVLDEVLKKREETYIGGSAEDDERLLCSPGTLTKHRRYAVVVRLGEKRILRDVREVVKGMLAEVGDGKEMAKSDKGGGKGGKGVRITGTKRVASGADNERGAKKARR
ncbi:SET domain-containing protein [Gyrodon lividus]|nr:SET domain-containing protein [Gyrodon lividus]